MPHVIWQSNFWTRLKKNFFLGLNTPKQHVKPKKFTFGWATIYLKKSIFGQIPSGGEGVCVCVCVVCVGVLCVWCVVCVVWVAHISIVKTKKLRFFRIWWRAKKPVVLVWHFHGNMRRTTPFFTGGFFCMDLTHWAGAVSYSLPRGAFACALRAPAHGNVYKKNLTRACKVAC